MTGANDELIIQCAWCRRYKLGGRWADPVYDPLVQAWQKHLPKTSITHGICEPCKERMLTADQENDGGKA